MKLTLSAAQRMLGGLRNIDQAEAVKLPGQTRLDIARNINRLLEDVTAYEKAMNAKRREIQPGEAHLAANNRIIAEMEALGDQTIEVKLYKIEHAKLNLDDNPRITGDVIAALAPILKDFDTLEEAAE